MMRVAKDSVDADILVNNGDTSISRAPRHATICKPLYEVSDSFALNSEYLNYLFVIDTNFTNDLWDYGVNVARKMWRHLWKSAKVGKG